MSISIDVRSKSLFKISSDSYRTGSVYRVCEGIFGDYPSVLVKETVNREAARNEVRMLQRLSDSENIMRLFHVAVTSEKSSLVVQRYDYNLLRYLRELKNQEYHQPPAFDYAKIFREVFQGLMFMHGKNIAHRNIRLKNVYIHQISGKKIHFKINFSQLINFFHSNALEREAWRSQMRPSLRPGRLE